MRHAGATRACTGMRYPGLHARAAYPLGCRAHARCSQTSVHVCSHFALCDLTGSTNMQAPFRSSKHSHLGSAMSFVVAGSMTAGQSQPSAGNERQRIQVTCCFACI